MIFPIVLLAALAVAGAHYALQTPAPMPSAAPSAMPTVTPPPPGQTPVPVGPLPTPLPTGLPSIVPSVAPSASPSASAAPTPVATPTGLNLPPLRYRVTPTPPPGATPESPQILEIDLIDETIGRTFAVRVLTNDVVERVAVKSGNRTGNLTKVAPGRFEAKGNAPRIGIATIKVILTFTAYSADGKSMSTTLSVRKK